MKQEHDFLDTCIDQCLCAVALLLLITSKQLLHESVRYIHEPIQQVAQLCQLPLRDRCVWLALRVLSQSELQVAVMLSRQLVNSKSVKHLRKSIINCLLLLGYPIELNLLLLVLRQLIVNHLINREILFQKIELFATNLEADYCPV